MILLDANVLIYSAVTDSVHHAYMKSWLDKKLNSPVPIGIPWPSLLAFVRITTNPRIYSPPAASLEAWKVVNYWLSCPSVWIPLPGRNHHIILNRIITEIKPTANLVPDAHLASLAEEHGLIVYSTDSDFARFPSIRWVNPLHEDL